MRHRDYTFLGTTQSLCPECLSVVPAKIISRRGRVYFRKTCPSHGVREDFVCSDLRQYDQNQFSVPGKIPPAFGVEPKRGCPLDCGLCTEHEQHTCVGLVELTTSCNLNCPMCYASSGPGGSHLSFEQCRAAIDRLVEVEGRAEVLQLSGGEPTIHPEFDRILDYAVEQPIDYVMINTNGVRFAHDQALLAHVASHAGRVEVYFQMDGLDDHVFEQLRGEALLDIKRKAIERLSQAGVNMSLVCTLQGGVNEDQIGPLVEYGLSIPGVTGVSFQPATYSGRHELPETLEKRITFPDVIAAIESQTDGLFEQADFMPLPCAHPNCHSLAYAFRSKHGNVPITRFFDVRNHFDLLANGISFNRPGVRKLVEQYLGRGNCGEHCDEGSLPIVTSSSSDKPPFVFDPSTVDSRVTDDFYDRIAKLELGARDVFRITITSFLDAYNFDVRRVMKCCTHHVLPSGHVIPFCAYNVLYREGHVPLPTLDWLDQRTTSSSDAASSQLSPASRSNPRTNSTSSNTSK